MIISSFSEFESDLLKKQKQKQKQKKNKISGKILRIFAKISGIKASEQKKNKTNKTNIKVYYSLYNDVNVTPAAIGRCPWSIGVQIHAWMTSRENCFICFVQHGARFWICLWDYFG